ncbi:hypothetical protein SEA_MADI_37 [Gordonia phage Madi]|uniref:DUF5710 domain-containing protein n=1 Tax=Gordonia phage Sienna TaxID=2759396 RepID=A0A7L7SIC4_9CAUD|nr:hypothetical protein SEA_SIENNA_37 [Gordonia phage Sienna]QYW00840.1 hypothetical protein SEA_MADI_37 [Gordonia phage Madi]
MATCGKCKGHAATVAEIRACYAGNPNAHSEAADAKRIENHGDNRAYLNVPYAEKDRVKGEPFYGKWDPQKRQWWVDRKTLRQFGKRMPDHWKGEPVAKATSGRSPESVEEGIYATPPGIYYKVYRSVHGMNPGQLITKVLVVKDGSGKWEYRGKRPLREIAAEGKLLSLEEAKAFGKMYGFCIRCGRTLTDEGSIAAGIGPICAGKFHEQPRVTLGRNPANTPDHSVDVQDRVPRYDGGRQGKYGEELETPGGSPIFWN